MYTTQFSRKQILLALTGGIACYKSAELCRQLIKSGYDVQVTMTQSATEFITPTTLQALSGKPVFISNWDHQIDNNMAHITLSRQADLIVIAPATANFLAKLANGHADDLLSTLCLARNCPLAVVPAMNKQMWDNPATQRNIALLKSDQIAIWGPGIGSQACGEVGEGRMLEPEEIVMAIDAFFTPKYLTGKKVLITAGPTFEAIDPVRGITNRSSGKMGYAIAQAAANSGATVKLVSGPTALPVPQRVTFFPVESAQSMLTAVMTNVQDCDIFIGVAAVADWGITAAPQKLKKVSGQDSLTLTFTRNPDILASVANLNPKPYTVGFAAETENLELFARQKLQSKKVDLIIANLATETFGKDKNQVLLVDANQTIEIPLAEKSEIAIEIIRHIASQFHNSISPLRK